MPDSWLQRLQSFPVIGIIRSPRRDWGYQMAATAIDAGIHCIEIAWGEADVTLPLILQLRQAYPQCSIGVGTILSIDQLHQAIDVGSQFGFSPIAQPSVIHAAQQVNFPFIPGATTPTEIFQTRQHQPIAIKVFPIKNMGGATYIKCLREAFGTLDLIPTGGITPEHIPDLLAAGAVAVGLSGGLFPRYANGEPDLAQTQTIAQQIRSVLSR